MHRVLKEMPALDPIYKSLCSFNGVGLICRVRSSCPNVFQQQKISVTILT